MNASTANPFQRSVRYLTGWAGRSRINAALVSVASVLAGLLVGAVLIAATDPDVQKSASYFFGRPSDFFHYVGSSVGGAYSTLFQGSVYNFRATGFAAGIRPLTETLTFAAPLTVAGLGVAVAFRAGMFNIGGRGQILFGAAASGWVGFAFHLPPGLHLIVALVAGMAAGALWGALSGGLKALTGAHEVITTIMLNFVAFYLVSYLLKTPGALQAPGSNNPETPDMLPTALLPRLFGDQYSINAGFLIALLATLAVWIVLERSTAGFRFRVVGENPNAARVAGIRVERTYVWVMALSGALVGLAGVIQVLGNVRTGFGSGIDAGIGFDAITVALLGRSRAGGVLAAGILFGALKAGGLSMQAVNGIDVNISAVVQAMIVLLIAAPPLVRKLFRIPKPTAEATLQGARS
ncbi:ABC transporter permease [Streptomyces sp. NPDC059477]|uniref:ABC transporter permease n=1 Tax=Streptomyces sp. NPDC059477 TaxID=3346847 RepID=UPI00368C00DF